MPSLPSLPPVPSPGSLPAKLWNGVTRAHVKVYETSGGRLGGSWFGAPVLLLEHVGRKSATRRTTPLLYLDDDPDLVIVASRGGSKATPAWWFNLEASPQVAVRVGSERREVVARTATAEEKDALWPRLVEMYSDYETYRRRTDRDIPVVILSPAER